LIACAAAEQWGALDDGLIAEAQRRMAAADGLEDG
jgi:hypothetical protein